MLYLKEAISCLNSPALLNQKIELQSFHVIGLAASKDSSKELWGDFIENKMRKRNACKMAIKRLVMI